MPSTNADKWWLVAQNKETTVWQENVTDDGVTYYFNTETMEKTFDKPEELMTEAELKSSKSKWVWVKDKNEAFLPAKLIRQGKTKSTVLVENSTEEKTVKTSETTPLLRKALLNRTVEDLTLLDEMSLPLILNNLKKRFVEKSQIYTNVGNILISINPYKRLDLYGEANIRRYFERKTDAASTLPPHVYDIAYASLYGVKSFGQNQSIVISGESGAGKTEATKQCLNFLAANAGLLVRSVRVTRATAERLKTFEKEGILRFVSIERLSLLFLLAKAFPNEEKDRFKLLVVGKVEGILFDSPGALHIVE